MRTIKAVRRGRRQVFKSPELEENEALREVGRFGGYSMYDPPGNVDRFVAPALKTYDEELYGEIHGQTKRGEGVTGLYRSLFRYSGVVGRWRHLSYRIRRAVALSYVIAKFKFSLQGREPLDWHEVGPHMRTDTSAGLSWPGKKKGQVMEQIYAGARWLGHRMKFNGVGSFDPRRVRFVPCTAAKRGHLSPIDDPKTRLVWVYPAEMLVIEGSYAAGMYRDYAADRQGPMLLGGSPQRIFRQYVANAPPDMKAYGLDFKAFDTKPAPWLIRMAFSIVHKNINWDVWRGKKVSVRDRQKWRNVWDGMVWYFINTPLLMPDGRLFRKYQGVPSGSWWTQIIDSIVNYIVIMACAILQGVTIRDLKVLGDDSVFWSKDFSIEQAVLDAKEISNMELSVDKSDVSELSDISEFKLLGTTYRGGRPWRCDQEWFSLLLYAEGPVRTPQESLSRFVGLWLAGAKESVRFCSFFRWWQSGYHLVPFGEFSMGQRRMLQVYIGFDPGKKWDISKLRWENYVLYS